MDRFHEENQYFGCLRDGLLLGSIAYRDRRPFSLDQKLPDLDAMIPQGRRWCEVRLLAVAPDARHTHVSALLLSCLVHHALAHGRDAGLLSGTTLQLPFYRHLGCQPFGPLVGREGALFQPMWILLETFMKRVGKVLKIPDASRAPIRTP
ncbi:MAG: GNAT family N-acetyltransferase [Verrucomicrobia bacterium]|nr:GNAT family N-acetyltransferase [Verrucomicrobiota bacterium]